ncbi:MAG TPA: pyridoxal-phosphate dependent enzyme [Vicinamibacterales bacterium]|jgi:1-aminocyclopropane-1-carboxylate deaminase/D-cysteine desulfhydrase-like pyridoxal-dependent ACC family enzyme
MPRSLDAIARFIATLPRLPLGVFPTPLVPLPRLSDQLGIDLWLKRDECSGLALGGNKTRKLEFVLADARARGCDTLVTIGPLTSNHTMMTAAAARRTGFKIHCIVGGVEPPPTTRSGNLLLLDYLGATLHFSPINYADPTEAEFEALTALAERVVAATGGYWIPGGGTMPQAEPGYMNAIAEIAAQRGGRFDFDEIVVAYGTGSTTTGILLGLALGGLGARLQPVAVQSRRAVEEIFSRKTTTDLFLESSDHLGLGFTAADVPPHEIVFGYADEGYGVPNAGSDAAIRLLATTEGYFLDPVYTAKAFWGLTQLVAQGRIAKGRRVLFIHTGGLSMAPAGEKRFTTPLEVEH